MAKMNYSTIGDTDVQIASEFARIHPARLRWTPGMGWMTNGGTAWQPDDMKKRVQLCQRLVEAAASAPGISESDRKRLLSARTVRAVLELAESNPCLALEPEAWDSDRLALNTPAGIVDLRTGSIRSRNESDFVTHVTSVSPRKAPCPAWTKFLKEVFLDDLAQISFMQRLCGYLLTGDRREQKIFFAYGLGANGKNTFFDLVAWIMGNYALKLPANALMLQRSEHHPTELAQLHGKRFAFSSELEESSHWAEALIKELTGDDTLRARFMRSDFFEFAQQQKHLIIGNYRPRLRGGDAALARRMVLLPFEATFSEERRDPDLPKRLREEAPAILSWMIEGAAAWHECGLDTPQRIAAASREYMESNDDVLAWIEECCKTGPEYESSSRDLYQSFATFIKERGQHTCSQRVWGERMASIPGISKRKSSGIKYTGISIRPPCEGGRQTSAPTW